MAVLILPDNSMFILRVPTPKQPLQLHRHGPNTGHGATRALPPQQPRHEHGVDRDGFDDPPRAEYWLAYRAEYSLTFTVQRDKIPYRDVPETPFMVRHTHYPNMLSFPTYKH